MATEQTLQAGPQLTIVVVSYHSHKPIRANLTGILSMPEFNSIIVDNAATEDSNQKLSQLGTNASVISNGVNNGYGRAANIGIKRAGTPYVLLLNPDLKADVESVQKLLDHAREDTNSNTAIWAPATLWKDYQESGTAEAIQWVSGSAMLFNREKILKLGGFDENIFLFAEDTDLCQRIIQAGMGIILFHDILFEHDVGQSSPPSPETEYLKWWHFGWSQCYRMVKHGSVTLWRNPMRKQLSYRIHALLSLNPRKRLKWRAKADGAKAYRCGMPAFRVDGSPQMSRAG